MRTTKVLAVFRPSKRYLRRLQRIRRYLLSEEGYESFDGISDLQLITEFAACIGHRSLANGHRDEFDTGFASSAQTDSFHGTSSTAVKSGESYGREFWRRTGGVVCVADRLSRFRSTTFCPDRSSRTGSWISAIVRCFVGVVTEQSLITTTPTSDLAPRRVTTQWE